MIGSSKIGLRPIRGGGGVAANPDFVFEVDTTQAGSASDTFVIPLLSGGTYDGTIDWGDGSTSATSYANRTHVYAAGGTYTITITGQIEGWFFANTGDKAKITDVSNWGTLTISNKWSFFGCSNLDISATDAPTITTTTFEYMFRGCSSLTNPDFSNWDTSTVTYCLGVFQLCPLFNGNVSTWDMSNVTLMQSMFNSCLVFNGDISGWDVSSNTDAVTMFYNNQAFNQDIGGWDMSSTTNIKYMLYNADAFDQSLANWTVTQMTDMSIFMTSATGLSTPNYDATLIAWDAQGTMAFSGTVNFGGSQYTSGGAAEAARTSLISKWGGITDGGAA